MSTTAISLGTTLADAINNSRVSTQAQVDHLNSNLKSIYLTVFNNWAISVKAGKDIPPTQPPAPPLGYIIGVTAEGFSFPMQGDDPVMPMPPVPDHPPIAPAGSGFTGSDSVKNVPPGDTMPVGYIATAPDGSHWKKTASPTPFGMAYYYAKVS